MTVRRRPAAVLPLVLAVVVLAVSVAVGMLASASTRIDAAEATWRRQQLRAVALSGLRSAMSQLESQREALIGGGTPSIDAELILYSDATGRGVATLLPLGDDGDLHAHSALAGLDLNRATAEMLARLPGLSEALAGKLVAARGKGFTSVEEAAAIAFESGLDLGAVFGSAARSPGESEPGAAPSGDPPLLSSLGVFGFDPEIQQGLGRNADAFLGADRVRPTAEWVKENRPDLVDRLGEPSAVALERLAATRGAFDTRTGLVRLLQTQGVPVEAWAGILDLAAVGDDQFARGVVDLNQAPAHVLAAVPGLDESTAAAIVARRDSVDDALRGTIAWPVIEGVLEPARLAQAADWLAARSLVWRVRVRGLIEPPSDAEPSSAATPGGVVIDAVIDLTGPRARLAYLREVTSMPLAVWLAERVESSAEAPIADERESAPPEPVEPDEGELRIERLSIRRGLSLSRLRPPAGAEEPGVAPTPPPDSLSARRDRRIGRWTPGPAGESERSAP
ncbi:MAG: hypothetical protein FJ255_07330 [Phycisphaerae bacterium]|nr:hypothetical protein [Phycisphaerae bacterium]